MLQPLAIFSFPKIHTQHYVIKMIKPRRVGKIQKHSVIRYEQIKQQLTTTN